ncbi:hypothetical protein NOR51B_1361 [Luminiphilus syltensis NOR5-1B]|uniref:Shikimate kinase n=1 Tax=Luminiphilus syltensis NOR5-1B TaxID=565045 RepID=B8KUW5_9GAMM|nr:hypothetical protein [Luminiphilus syltensis]EED35416.1 hypothetical protein NOR51B_1361 [Luminiphilus syltensis NOR5-1B]
MTSDSETISPWAPGGWRHRTFQAVKYFVYLALGFNIYLFLQQETATAAHSGSSEWTVTSVIAMFSATIDTIAWVVLLLLFELETAVLPDEKLVGGTKLSIHTVRLLCGLLIIFAAFGYYAEWIALLDGSPIVGSACELVGQDWSLMLKFDDFAELSATNCDGTAMVNLTNLDQVVASEFTHDAAKMLASVDLINAAAWILIVIMLEIEVRLQLKGGVPARVLPVMNTAKIVLYGTLLWAAVYWGFRGDFLDFWDAALWLFAFVFIELNVFEWQNEIGAKSHEEITD